MWFCKFWLGFYKKPQHIAAASLYQVYVLFEKYLLVTLSANVKTGKGKIVLKRIEFRIWDVREAKSEGKMAILTDNTHTQGQYCEFILSPHFFLNVSKTKSANHNVSISFLNNHPDALIIPILFCYKTLHVSNIFSAHHQEFSTVHSALVSLKQVSGDHFQAESGWNILTPLGSGHQKPASNLPVPNVQ